MLHSLLENRWFQVSGGFEGPGRAISGGWAVKKVQPKDPIRPRWGKKTRAYLSPKKIFCQSGFWKNYEKLIEIMKNNEKLRFGAYFKINAFSTLFLCFFYAFSMLFPGFFYAFSGLFPAPIKSKFFEISWKIREFPGNYDNL